jgi:hypothetical protein
MARKLRAQDNMKEFDPTSEQHWPLLIVKAVDGGCTTELQIENATNGDVTRVTTTDNEEFDDDEMERALQEAFQIAWNNLKEHGNETE